jgi:hypothetical protein
MTTINGRGGFSGTARGILVKDTTKTESQMTVYDTTL